MKCLLLLLLVLASCLPGAQAGDVCMTFSLSRHKEHNEQAEARSSLLYPITVNWDRFLLWKAIKLAWTLSASVHLEKGPVKKCHFCKATVSSFVYYLEFLKYKSTFSYYLSQERKAVRLVTTILNFQGFFSLAHKHFRSWLIPLKCKIWHLCHC